MNDFRRLIQRVVTPSVEEIDPWEWAIAAPYRCLADPASFVAMPADPAALPRTESDFHQRFRQSVSYYTALQSFLTYSFGWSRHDKGLLWWYEQGWPTDDPRLALIREILFYDGTLTGYAAWCAALDPQTAIDPLRQWLIVPDTKPVALTVARKREFEEALARPPWVGGSDPMHLGGGIHGGAASLGWDSGSEPTDARLVGVDIASRTAVFVAEDISHWYSKLNELGIQLPALPSGRNWRVDVYVRAIGFLGTYRKSHATGLWFSGRHKIHAAGN